MMNRKQKNPQASKGHTRIEIFFKRRKVVHNGRGSDPRNKKSTR